MTEASKYEVIVAGGGMAGLPLGIALAQAGLEICVVDGLDPDDVLDASFDGRVSSFAPASVQLLQAIGVWPLVQEGAQPIWDIVVSDGTVREGASPALLHFDHEEMGEGPLAHMIENRHFRAALQRRAMECKNLTIIAPCRVEQLSHDRVGTYARLSNGRVVTAAVCVAADGRDSPLRRAAGIQSTGWSYEQTGIVACLGHEREHDGTAYELFLPSGPFAILPMTGRRSSIVWSERSDQASAYLKMSDGEFLQETGQRFGDQWGDLTLLSSRWNYPLSMHIAHRLVAPRFALLGDAARVVHPIAGQGLNLALRDVAALAEVLIEAARHGLELGDVATLERYEAWRRYDNLLFAASMDGLNRLFSNDIGPLRYLRRAGLDLVDALPGLKSFFVRQARGDSFGCPRLLKGQAL